MNPENQTEWQGEAKCYQAPHIVLELELEAQAGSTLSLPDLEEEINEAP
jgi:hypothetical protein